MKNLKIMKNLYVVFILLLIPLWSCKAQTIVPYDSDQDVFSPNSGAYYKDTNNEFNKYEGEWKWENALTNSEITFIFKKEVALDAGEDNFTYDLLVGEYRYVENGQEIVNTLSDIDAPNITGDLHNISGMLITKKYARPICNECTDDERRVSLIISHDEYDYIEAWLLLRYFVENGVEKIKVIISDGASVTTDPNAPEDIDIPLGEYIMVKQ